MSTEINTDSNLEWWETFDGILNKFKETIEENKVLKTEIEDLKKQLSKRKKTTKTNQNN